MNLAEIIQHEETHIVDVRTPGEFAGGNVAGSKNIPLNEVPDRINDFKEMKGNIVLCCASGGRSGQATMFLNQNGLTNVHNGGGWMEVNFHKNK